MPEIERPTGPPRSVEDHAHRLFEFFAQVNELKTRPVRTLDNARRLLWLADLPDEPKYIRSVLAPDADPDAWISMKRIEAPEPPAVPELLVRWIDQRAVIDHTAAEPPALHNAILVDPRIIDAWDAWARQWTEWAEKRRSLTPLIDAYHQLYATVQDTADEGELYELVLAFGYLTRSSGGQDVRRHLLTLPAVAAYDPETGNVTVGPDPDRPRPSFEEDMLDPGDRAPKGLAEELDEDLDEIGVLAAESVDVLHRVLKTWTFGTGPDGRYLDAMRPQTGGSSGGHAVVSFAPALVLRPRGSRSFAEVLHSISAQIERTGSASALVRHLIKPERPAASAFAPEFDGPRTPAQEAESVDAAEVFFALPSNADQRTIADRLRTERLVVVQGPPGTGKTHTIGNLLTDLLAHGKRVLITSHTAKALKVLKDKLPEELQPLCVSRADDGQQGQLELEHSVKGILSAYGDYDSRRSATDIKSLTGQLREARTRQSEALARLRTVREMETYFYSPDIGDYTGTPVKIAERLRSEEHQYSWIGPVSNDLRPVTAAETLNLLHAVRALTPEVEVHCAELPDPDAFREPESFAETAAEILDANRRIETTRGQWDAELADVVAELPDERQRHLATGITAFIDARDDLAVHQETWVGELSARVLADEGQMIRYRRIATMEALTAAAEAVGHLGPALVTGLEQFDLPTALGQSRRLSDGLASGQKLTGVLGTKSRLLKEVEAFHAAVRVDGALVGDVRSAAAVLARVEIERQLQSVEESWGQGPYRWQPHMPRIARLENELVILDKLTVFANARKYLVQIAAVVPGIRHLNWQDRQRTASLQALLDADLAVRATAAARHDVSSRARTLRTWADGEPTASPDVAIAAAALDTYDATAYREAYTRIAATRAANAIRTRADEAHSAVAALHPALAEQIRRTADDTAWDSRLTHIDRAWAWSRWNARLARLTDPGEEAEARRELAEADDEVRMTSRRLAVERAWDFCLSRITDEQSRALSAYQQNIRKIGKGTGRHAYRYRSLARENLREAQSAVPAWIMPLHQVVATVPMDRAELFDVVIVDEASQSGLEAILLGHLAQRMIVVGDDKQVSPAEVGLDQDQFFELRNRRLAGVPGSLASLLIPGASLFDLAAGVAGGRGRLMLKEHFRCMPEIIDFSNTLCYNGVLQPMRQYGADRLPPIRTVYAGGVVEGTGQKQVNRAEAEQLVDQLVACCEDPAYDGRTMGVITMLGTAQAALIEELVTERLSVATRRERKLRVGNAEAFQGDERHVVFISLVVAREGDDGRRRIGHFSTQGAEQRINVAASRAQDQVWVFHSVHPGDLGETDLRRRYLEHLVKRPAERDVYLEGTVSPDIRREPFDSLFEQRVYLALRARGYRVRPQYPAGRYRIDLVVEGGTRRLAVECDGEAYHGEENAEADAARQRELERVGWTFVRIRGSRFFRDPREALEPVWAALDEAGILPV